MQWGPAVRAKYGYINSKQNTYYLAHGHQHAPTDLPGLLLSLLSDGHKHILKEQSTFLVDVIPINLVFSNSLH